MKSFFITVFFFLGFLLSPASSNGMEIKQYDQMSRDDQSRYLSHLFTETALLLFDKGDEAGVEKIETLTSVSGGKLSRGWAEVLGVINDLRDMKNLPQPPHVEHGIAIALNRHGINLRPHMDEFMQVAKDFKPTFE
jgi:hypothetical protein